MPRSDFQFVSTDANELVTSLVSAYEGICEITVQPASPEMLFIRWVASVLVQQRSLLNFVGNQNIPARAEGENLDALAELFYAQQRPAATPAACTVRFSISETQERSVYIPAGTRVTDNNTGLIWSTQEDAYVLAGQTYVDAQVLCETPGEAGNGYAEGTIDVLVDIYDYYDTVSNITASAGGSNEATDAEFYELLRAGQDAYSVAGPRGAYIYHAKNVSTDIADVIPTTPSAGKVNLYVLMEDGKIANEEIKRRVLEACNDMRVRPLTDHVSVEDPEEVEYEIEATYYVSRSSGVSLATVEADVNAAVEKYMLWQSTSLGRDINPSYLIQLLMEAGAKRVEVTKPVFTKLEDGASGASIPQVAKCSKKTVTNGGYEDE